MGKTIVHVGPAGAGQVVKVCNQVVVAVVIEAVSEALVLGAKAGVDPSRIADVLQGGLAATKVLEMRRDNMLTGRFDPGFRIRLHLKDLKNALELARETGVALPAAALVEQLMRGWLPRARRLRPLGAGDAPRGPGGFPPHRRGERRRGDRMTPTASESPLLRMTLETPTDWWNDSCHVDDLAHAVERGATGATSNPTIVLEVMQRGHEYWWPRVRELAQANPTWSEVELAWAVVDEMAVRGATVLQPVFDARGGRKGRQTVQTNPANYRDPARMTEQAVRLAGLAPNIQVKFPATAAGIDGIEEATFFGVNTMATVSFTVAQAIAAARAAERGLDRREAGGLDISDMAPIVVLMIGRLDDWMKALVERDGLAVDPAAPNWAGIAVFKRTYDIFQDRLYRSRLLAAATRHPLHWTELVGGDVAMTITPSWQARFNGSGIVPTPRMHVPVEPAIIAELAERIPDFGRAYEPDGLAPAEFERYGATARTLRAFIASYHDLLGVIREITLPNPDVKLR